MLQALPAIHKADAASGTNNSSITTAGFKALSGSHRHQEGAWKRPLTHVPVPRLPGLPTQKGT